MVDFRVLHVAIAIHTMVASIIAIKWLRANEEV